MEPSEPAAPPPIKKVDSSLPTMQPGEQVIFNLRRHPIGIIGVYLGAAIVIIIVAIFCFVVPSQFTQSVSSQVTQVAGVTFLLVTVMAIIFVFIATIIYWGNQWVLTSDSITQVNQNGLFRRESSQLSLGNVEDVTSEQNGILTHIFNYGALKVETAGETGKFVFAFCPNPNYYAQQLLVAREAFDKAAEKNE